MRSTHKIFEAQHLGHRSEHSRLPFGLLLSYLVFQSSVLASIETAGSHDSKHNGLHNNAVAFIDTLPEKSTFMGM